MSDLYPEQDAELGRLVRHMGDLEFNLTRLVWALAEMPTTYAPIVTSKRDMNDLAVMAVKLAVARAMPAEAVSTLKSIQREIHQVAEERNALVHAGWALDASGTDLQPVRLRAHKLGTSEFQAQIEPQDIRRLGDRGRALDLRIYDWRKNHSLGA